MDAPLSPERFAEIANVSRETLDRLRIYAAQLAKWQKALNLVSRSTLSDVWRRHMLDSAQLVPFMPDDAQSITDIGSGAGFPGLVLAIVTDIPTALVESDARKGAFLREVVRLTHAPATVETVRIESVETVRIESRGAHPENKSVDILTARALAPLGTLCEMADSLKAQTCVFLKGGQWRDELTDAGKSWKMDVETFGSLTSPEGCILRLRNLRRIGS